MRSQVMVRRLVKDDETAVLNILNEAIRAGTFVAYTEEISLAQMRPWFEAHCVRQYPLFVAEVNGEVVGWSGLSAYRPGRRALAKTVEVSYGVAASMRQKGIGSAMLKRMLEEAIYLGHRVIFAIIFDTNLGSRRLLEKYGFSHWGHLPMVAELGGALIGHDYLGMVLSMPSKK